MHDFQLSIILPIYNVENYLERCISSIEKQDFTDYEVIFVDDGSTDSSGRLADELSKRFTNSIVIHKENGGLSSARNAGLEKANGEYVFMIDSDDWLEQGALSKIMKQASTNPDIIKFNLIRRPNGEVGKSEIAPGIYEKKIIREKLIKIAIERTENFIFSAWSHVYKLDFLNDNAIRFISEREIGSEDYLFNTEAFLAAEKVAVIEDPLYNYDLRDGSLTQKYRENLCNEYIKLHELMQKAITRNGLQKELEESLAFSFIEKMMWVCFVNECTETAVHTIKDGYRNIHRMVRTEECQKYLKKYPYYKANSNRKFIVSPMKINIVLPVIYLIRR
ncbi:glycosyltransferase [Butyrivibrio sp. AC2005]|uniref:glycosyltransferase n=1 Tax=Butyrivibrio sp. AC2005 TaxID=1280672 RepID=UPI00040D0F76|nr:glycosyltransferase [Butyrivibrio sp. AC2005]